MEISRNKHVSLVYELRTNGFDGELHERAVPETPLSFLYGIGAMLPKFEEKLEGLKQGEKFEFMLPVEEAYGEVNKDAVVDIPKNIFEVDGKIDEEMLKVGNNIPMMDSSGNHLNGLVLEVQDDTVKMDFNHPMAGEDLYFSGEVLEVREATDEEIAQAAGVGAGCEGGCSSCGDGCGDEEANGSCESGSCGCGC